jgi:6,7-dimethyl-8-ribityllumazine synthase
MATKNLSNIDWSQMPEAGHFSFGIVVSEWNNEITNGLLKGALDVLKKAGVKKSRIKIVYVPGSFELAHGAQLLIESQPLDGVICLGCVIRGETAHFDFVSQATATGVMNVGLQYAMPVIFGVLTDDNIQQSKDRSGGKKGNKGSESAATVIKMAALRSKLNAL